ncbi:cytochrome c oxidase subunit II [Hoyosella rhizosphaerae]|uniref:cytochrome-c oxidase n=1 Tax=Hoyosella rhizosphaerae TaxID=1755582 RepID=A0A916UGQ8_9ACTN|nr:cytochrome c oxidase subunit II [Hoyosella rhizosphaerae]MBN4927958.1 cytochrome c oxidase subunit II [Hoyosella rhizosphaerae]GGC71272.1 putative cytochrome c oxidase subunit 2 precursor [Hoyosella rhizosphaerae]
MNVAHGSRRRIARRTGLAATLGIAAVLLSGCSIDNAVLRFGWPSGVTPQAQMMRELWTWSVVAALIMGVIVWGLTFWTVIFHRKKKGDPDFPRQTGYNVPLELLYTAVPFVIIAVLFYFTVVVQNFVNDKEHGEADVVVDVTAYQWNWKFGYRTIDMGDGTPFYDGSDPDGGPQVVDPNDDDEFGPIHGKRRGDLSYLEYNTIETLGSSEEIPVLVLPTNRRIEFVLASSDVVHSFWVPEFLFKRDVLPNPAENHSDFSFQISEIEREGAFVGRCAEMCGTYHAMMNFEVRAVSPERFAEYIELRKPTVDGGQGLSNAEALEAIGESPVSVTTVPFETRREAQTAIPFRSGN